MCQHGDVVELVLNHTKIKVDKCLVPYIKALNTNGIMTAASCCGHGEIDGSVVTMFGDEYRLIIICPPESGTPKRWKDEFQKSQEKFDRINIRKGVK